MSVAVGDLARAHELYRAALDPSAACSGSPLLERGPGPFEVKLRAPSAREPIEALTATHFTFE